MSLKKTAAIICSTLLIFAVAGSAGLPAYAGLISGDKPYLSLGADLTSSEKQTVYQLLGVDSDDLDKYGISTVTNQEEH